jgi:hypothetical protein
MLLSFLRAEFDSPTERERLESALRRINQPAMAITSDDADAETLHRIFMAFRGEEQIFCGLDLRTFDWHEVDLAEPDLARIVTCRNHFEERFGTRELGAVALALKRSGKSSADGIIERTRAGVCLERPILLAEPDIGRMVILEGHNRMIAYETHRTEVQFPIKALLGTSSAVSRWSQW